MVIKKNPTMAATSMETPNARLYQQPVQDSHLVWLDGDVNNDDYRSSITNLQQFVNSVDTFTDANECINFLTSIKQENTFMIVSGEFCEIVVPIVQDISHVNSVYIFCRNKEHYEEWAKEWPKVKG